MSRVLPILFNIEMVRAILDGRKTVTRRIVKIPYELEIVKIVGESGNINNPLGAMYLGGIKRPPYQPGDILYVRETWCNANIEGVEPDYYYYADVHICEDYNRTEWKWRPSIHMPKEAARIWLKVTDVRVERLQDITEEGAIKEGLYKGWKLPNLPKSSPAMTARQAFMWIWDPTLKKTDRDRYGWIANPWVWVIGFERCDKPESEG